MCYLRDHLCWGHILHLFLSWWTQTHSFRVWFKSM